MEGYKSRKIGTVELKELNCLEGCERSGGNT